MNRIERNPMIWDNEEAERQLEALWKLKQTEAVRTDHDALMEWAILVFVVWHWAPLPLLPGQAIRIVANLCCSIVDTSQMSPCDDGCV